MKNQPDEQSHGLGSQQIILKGDRLYWSNVLLAGLRWRGRVSPIFSANIASRIVPHVGMSSVFWVAPHCNTFPPLFLFACITVSHRWDVLDSCATPPVVTSSAGSYR